MKIQTFACTFKVRQRSGNDVELEETCQPENLELSSKPELKGKHQFLMLLADLPYLHLTSHCLQAVHVLLSALFVSSNNFNKCCKIYLDSLSLSAFLYFCRGKFPISSCKGRILQHLVPLQMYKIVIQSFISIQDLFFNAVTQHVKSRKKINLA